MITKLRVVVAVAWILVIPGPTLAQTRCDAAMRWANEVSQIEKAPDSIVAAVRRVIWGLPPEDFIVVPDTTRPERDHSRHAALEDLRRGYGPDLHAALIELMLGGRGNTPLGAIGVYADLRLSPAPLEAAIRALENLDQQVVIFMALSVIESESSAMLELDSLSDSTFRVSDTRTEFVCSLATRILRDDTEDDEIKEALRRVLMRLQAEAESGSGPAALLLQDPKLVEAREQLHKN